MPNKLYQQAETPVVWGSEAGDDEALTSESVVNGAGRRGAIHDFGAAPRADLYQIEFWAQFAATPTQGNGVRLYVYEGGPQGSTTVDHQETGAGTDAALSSKDTLDNASHVLSLTIREATANVEFYRSGRILVPARHWGVAFWNDSGASTTSDASHTKVRVTPIPPEIQ